MILHINLKVTWAFNWLAKQSTKIRSVFHALPVQKMVIFPEDTGFKCFWQPKIGGVKPPYYV